MGGLSAPRIALKAAKETRDPKRCGDVLELPSARLTTSGTGHARCMASPDDPRVTAQLGGAGTPEAVRYTRPRGSGLASRASKAPIFCNALDDLDSCYRRDMQTQIGIRRLSQRSHLRNKGTGVVLGLLSQLTRRDARSTLKGQVERQLPGRSIGKLYGSGMRKIC